MKTNDNQYYIYLRATKQRIPCTKEEFDNYYHDITLFRQRQQYSGHCACPKRKWLDCDMDCQTCLFRRDDSLSLDYTTKDRDGNESTWGKDIADPLATVDTEIEKEELLNALRSALDTLTSDEKDICATIMDNLSERSAAAALNLSRNTYVYRRDKVLGRLKKSLENYM